jgi:A nuclease family of the HNH/ENDO VII superfamily with conserved AHH
VAGYGISQGVGTLKDRSDHGQSNTDLSDAEVRGTWLGLTADSLSMFAVGSALRLGKGGLGLVDEVGTVGKALNIGAQYADTAAIGNSTVSLAQNWDRLTPQQQLASIGQLGFWATMTGVSAKQAGGFENLYGAKSIRETFGGKEIPIAQSSTLNPGDVNVSYGKGTPNVNHGGEVEPGNIQIHVDKAKEIRKENSPFQKVKNKVLGNKSEFEYGTKGWELNHEASKHQAMAESVFEQAKIQRAKGNTKAADRLEQEAHDLLRSSYEYRASAHDPRVRNTPGDGEIAAGKRRYDNHSEIESLIGKKFDATTTKLPPGYQVIEVERGRKVCAVIDPITGAFDLSKGILLVRPSGQISVDPQNRTSYDYIDIYRNDPRARADVLAAGFGRDGYTIHHVIGDKVASEHPLMVMDMRLNKFTVDTFENYAPLPMKQKFQELQGTEVGHWSGHKNFDDGVRAKLTDIQEELEIKYDSPISEWLNHPQKNRIAAEMKSKISNLQSGTLSDIKNGNVPMTDEGMSSGIGRIN